MEWSAIEVPTPIRSTEQEPINRVPTYLILRIKKKKEKKSERKMVQVLEKVQEIIIIEVPEVKKEEVKASRIQEIKAKLSRVKDYAKKHEYYLNINDVKTKMAINSYGMRLFRNY